MLQVLWKMPSSLGDPTGDRDELKTMDPEVGFDPCDLPVCPQRAPLFPSHGMPVMLLSWRPRHSEDFVAAGIAAATNIIVTYPVFKAIVRIQVGKSTVNWLRTMNRLLITCPFERTDGWHFTSISSSGLQTRGLQKLI